MEQVLFWFFEKYFWWEEILKRFELARDLKTHFSNFLIIN